MAAIRSMSIGSALHNNRTLVLQVLARIANKLELLFTLPCVMNNSEFK